jgi:hypothetical protein
LAVDEPRVALIFELASVEGAVGKPNRELGGRSATFALPCGSMCGPTAIFASVEVRDIRACAEVRV